MSPGGRRGRALASSDETHLRDLSPDTTLRAFTVRPMPYDTTRDEYKMFACIDSLTPAERDLGTRVAKAAQRLKSWCDEIGQWGWSGSFEQPSDEFKEERRKSLQTRIQEHIKLPDHLDQLPTLEYWGSMLSVEVQAHEARLDDISEELITLDVEDLKGHVLDMHPGTRSRPSSAGYGSNSVSYKPLDDFNFLITQTLISALPHHFRLRERLNTWTARVTVLRQAPRYLDDLKTAQKALRMGWEALSPPEDASDAAYDTWRNAVDTIARVMQDRVGDLGRRLDKMLDTLEGQHDHLPDRWIDVFEGVEGDYGRWTQESRRKMIEFDVRRHGDWSAWLATSNAPAAHSDDVAPTTQEVHTSPEAVNDPNAVTDDVCTASIDQSEHTAPRIAHGQDADTLTDDDQVTLGVQKCRPLLDETAETPISITSGAQEDQELLSEEAETPISTTSVEYEHDVQQHNTRVTPSITIAHASLNKHLHDIPEGAWTEPDFDDDESVFEEGDTVVHNDIHYSYTDDLSFADESQVILPSIEETDGTVTEPRTPRSRRESMNSTSSGFSPSSSPPSAMEVSPSIRDATNKASRAPRPALNAAMTKRRKPELKPAPETPVERAPWPPTQFSHSTPTSADDFERKISDVLSTIPAHIRLTSSKGADARRTSQTLTNKGSKGYLRAARSYSSMRSPELTLSAARQETDSANTLSGRRSTASLKGDNDIRMYHLTQPGKDKPVKLFIRRVGENGERVMVRVGGGWADLGEYLRQYAEHHGRRTASNGQFEILGLEVNRDGTPTRSESAMSRRDRCASAGAGRARSTTPNSTPKRPATRAGYPLDDEIPPVPKLSPGRNGGTPGPTGSTEASTPPSDSSRRSWRGEEVGLAGPKSKKIDLSNEKMEWIEGMMKQARTVSGNLLQQHTPQTGSERVDSRSESRSKSRSESRAGAMGKHEFGDLGKVGGTKRVYLRGGALQEH